ncbi:MAG TPA: DUF1801 domain-containing protein [Pyrinomonadaceae bacterium]
MNQEFNEFLEPFTPEVQEISLCLRSLIFKNAPDIFENIYSNMKIVRYGVEDNKLEGIVCHIAPLKSAVNFGLYRGAVLPDPSKLMEGTGKMLRHVKVKNVAEAESAALRTLLKAALTETSK